MGEFSTDFSQFRKNPILLFGRRMFGTTNVGGQQALFHPDTAGKGRDIDFRMKQKDARKSFRLRLRILEAIERDILINLVPMDTKGIYGIILPLGICRKSQSGIV